MKKKHGEGLFPVFPGNVSSLKYFNLKAGTGEAKTFSLRKIRFEAT